MIKTKADLKHYLTEDLKRFSNKPGFKDWILKNEVWYIYKYQRTLRYVEYYKNSGESKLLYLFYFFIYKRLCYKLKIDIKPNNMGPGLRIYHLGSLIRIKTNCIIGKNCSLQPGVVIGNKNLEDDGSFVRVGDNSFFGLGSKVFGEVNLGHNVVVGANSVVVKNVPNNSVVSGIPAKIIKTRVLK
ncbi:DapH/DapD/GlmU-related protein [uncultured Maribacter sp.]|uniref:DapH/DapD/GlmU-related protein n=1 Tax=uncultured Maribacter sp. TaxID=431308 RepID=UPI00261A53D5|nr:DapH/DapD/GlmU-related protein [uncultured Maribacter sp.]